MEEDYNGELRQSELDQQSATNVKNHVTLVKVRKMKKQSDKSCDFLEDRSCAERFLF